MKQLFLVFFALFLSFAFTIDDAQARRMGGGRSIGMQRNITKSPSQNPAQNPAASTGNRWATPLAGLAAGLGLAALASALGLGEAFGSVLLIMLLFAALFVLISLFKKRAHAPMAFAGAPSPHFTPPQGAPKTVNHAIKNFNAEEFLRHAKVHFIRLQAANDAKNAEDIREFVSPEVFAEIKMDWDERGDAPQHSDVQNLNAEVLDVDEEATRYVVSVLFSGKIKENNQAAEHFSEIWHMTKSKTAGGWVVSGIEQNHSN